MDWLDVIFVNDSHFVIFLYREFCEIYYGIFYEMFTKILCEIFNEMPYEIALWNALWYILMNSSLRVCDIRHFPPENIFLLLKKTNKNNKIPLAKPIYIARWQNDTEGRDIFCVIECSKQIWVGFLCFARKCLFVSTSSMPSAAYLISERILRGKWNFQLSSLIPREETGL